jgi:phosphoglycolate phosphatase-like HAD superfamily hydrolase
VTRLSKILLFDIDGTLLLSGRAGYRALTRAFEELFGVSKGFDGVPVAGMTDELILTAALEQAGVNADGETRARFHTRYCELFADEIHFPGPRKGLMPGVTALLETLRRHDDVRCGLLTGNFAKPAQIKLEHFDLWRFFHFGAYGDDATVRDELVPIAVNRARHERVAVEKPSDVVVIGDTPLDVQCAEAGGARSVAVATGSYDEAALRETGANAVLADFSDTDLVVDLLRSS